MKRIQLLFFFVLFGSVGLAHSEELISSPAPDWVIERELGPLIDIAEARDSVGFQILLLDEQYFLGAGKPAVFSRNSVQLNSIQSIERFGTIRIPFVPVYHTYSFHWLRILRDGEVLEVLDEAAVTFHEIAAQPNTPAHEAPTVIQLVVPGLRKGDVLDFGLTVYGNNDAFVDHVVQMAMMSVPTETLEKRVRFIAPEDRSLNIKHLGNVPAPTVLKEGGQVYYDWKLQNVEGFELERNVPAWQPQFEAIVVSDFATWPAMRKWAEPLFAKALVYDENVSAFANGLVEGLDHDVDRLKAITGFVRSQIRYIGMEMGRNGYMPFTPSEVLSRRFGDCKDQVVLLQAMLKEVGIKSQVAFVNSKGERWVETLGPTPFAFDHAIILVEVDGYSYWIDPTTPLVEASNVTFDVPDFGVALVLGSDRDGLHSILEGESRSHLPGFETMDHFDLSAGLHGAANWRRDSIYRGEYAESVRMLIENHGLTKLGTWFQDSESSAFEEGLESEEFFSIEDDVDFLTTHEVYSMPVVGTEMEGGGRQFAIKAKKIREGLVMQQESVDRKYPLALPYPFHRKATFRIVVPHITVSSLNEFIESPYHRFRMKGGYVGDDYQLVMEYEVLQDHVPVDKITNYLEQADEVWDHTDYFLFWRGDAESEKEAIESGDEVRYRNRFRDTWKETGNIAVPDLDAIEVLTVRPEGLKLERMEEDEVDPPQ